MKCLICGKETDNQIICEECKPRVSEELCYKVAMFNYKEPNNKLWGEICSNMEKPYGFPEFSLYLADEIDEKRRIFAKIRCINLMCQNYGGVGKKYREYVIEQSPKCEKSNDLTNEEKNLVKALSLSCLVSEYAWERIGDLPEEICADGVFLDTTLILADYYMKIYDYQTSIGLLENAKKLFLSELDQAKIESCLADCRERESGNKKAWRPSKRSDIEDFNRYLDMIGVAHGSLSVDKKEKIREADFKPFKRYEESSVPEVDVALWITSEFYLKANEIVEVSALRVKNGEITESFHSFVQPMNKPKKPVHVKEEDYINAENIQKVFSKFMRFAKDDIFVIAGFDEQKRLLSRLARYSMLDHLDNEILDIVEYGEDMSDDFTTYTRSTLLEKYDVAEGVTGVEKANATVVLTEKLR